MKKLVFIVLALTVTSLLMAAERDFAPRFTILYSATNPKLATKPAGIKNVPYNVAVWLSVDSTNTLQQVQRRKDQFGDGFDDAILSVSKDQLTPEVFAAGQVEELVAKRVKSKQGIETWEFNATELGQMKAQKEGDILRWSFTPAKAGYYSVAYTGAPSCAIPDAEEIWQPLIWQELRVPNRAYMTLAYRCPIPTTLLMTGGTTYGVVADSTEFPFNPLPTLYNSRFGVALRTMDGQLQPQLYAPVLGGTESKRQAGETMTFTVHLYEKAQTLSAAFEDISRRLCGFHDYRVNMDISLNQTMDNMLTYAMSEYAMFIDSLKGCNYSTDAPGAVKNVSSLHPLQMYMVTGREDIFRERAYPMMEYMISREKFLFAIDSTQKIQSPSRQLNGPCAPVSELALLYKITHRQNPFLLSLAEKEYNSSRTRNLSTPEKGDNWQNALALYVASGDSTYLRTAMVGADRYIQQRVTTRQTAFNEGGYFFWNAFTADWACLLGLYEYTHEQRYLDAAHDAMRQYAMFVWQCPAIPEGKTIVNPDGWAPWYPYLKGKGYAHMAAAPDTVDNWRLSEIGLTAESSGTSTGHRGIFMVNYAPWMLRIGYLTGDQWLMDIARSAVIGRYRNFPGYHINTARTTVYEGVNYPYHRYNELSVNSFHYNHIWPHINILLDYLVTDAFVKSHGEVDFPSDYIEGFGYLKNKFYAHNTGRIYAHENVTLYMPQGLITTTLNQLNYIAGYDADNLYIVLLNQSDEVQEGSIAVTDSLCCGPKAYRQTVRVPANGIQLVTIPRYRGKTHDYVFDPESGLTGVLIHALGKTTLYMYINKPDGAYRDAEFTYQIDGGEAVTTPSKRFPFEQTLVLPEGSHQITISVMQHRYDGQDEQSKTLTLNNEL